MTFGMDEEVDIHTSTDAGNSLSIDRLSVNLTDRPFIFEQGSLCDHQKMFEVILNFFNHAKCNFKQVS